MNLAKSIHTVVFVPGLGGDVRKVELVAKLWRGFTPIVFDMQWRDGRDFEPKLRRLLQVIDSALMRGKVSIVGLSAGGSAIGNVFLERKDKLNAMVNVCGRLRRGPLTGFRSFEKMTQTSPAFRQSTERFEDSEQLLSVNDRKRILTIRSLADELVPGSTIPIEGATNIIVPSVEHSLSIGLATTLFSGQIQRFLKDMEQ